MTVLLFMTQIKNRDTPIEVECAFKGKVIFCVWGVASPLLANVYLHYVFDLWANRWRQREATGDMIIVRYADDVRHFTGRWIPFTERRGLEETTLGPTAYPAVKAKGDRSMPSKRERPEDADGRVPQGPRDKVRTALFEPQSAGMQAYIPRHSV